MDKQINIVTKPDWVTWDEIKKCLYDAHADNRAKGLNMTHYLWSASKIQEFIGAHGVMLVALDENKVVGTAALAEREGKAWYAKGTYAYMCFAGILPEYRGLGLYKVLIKEREKIAKSLGYQTILFDTHFENKIIHNIAKKNGYRFVRFFLANSMDHYSVVMVKWLLGSPYSKSYCRWKYLKSILKVRIKTVISLKRIHPLFSSRFII